MDFINLNNGLIYNGSLPFVHKFEDGQSININYSKTLAVYCDKPQVRISLKSDIFSLVDLSNIEDSSNEVVLSQKSFINLNKIKTTEIISNGYLYLNKYIHVFYIVAKSDIIGDITDSFYIDDEEFHINGDFYSMDERLTNSLENFELKMPESIQKAIYEVNVHEEATNNILLNRKYKELLQNYYNIIMTKGTYNSLINSLSWFEWGDLLRFEEYWKRHDYQDAYLPQNLSNYLDEETLKYLTTISKTTYYGLYCCLYKQEPHKFDEEGNPLLTNILSKWSSEDLSLKMILLGNFYQTYFMPLHLDLLHSAIEHCVFTVNKKILNSNSIEFNNTFNSVCSFECDVNINPKLKIQQLYKYKSTLFNETNGVDTRIKSEDAIQTWYYNDICAVSKFNCKIPGKKIKKSKLICYHDNKVVINTIDQHFFDGENFSFELFFKNAGQWNVLLEFETIDCFTYSKELNIYVEDDSYNSISLYKLKYNENINSIKDINIKFGDFFFNLPNTSNANASNILCINNRLDIMNRIIICEVSDTTPIILQFNNKLHYITSQLGEIELDKLSLNTSYIWLKMNADISSQSPERIILISKKLYKYASEVRVINPNNLRYVDEPRFVLGFFDAELITEPKICSNDLIIAVPNFKHSNDIEGCFWTLENKSTGKTYKSNYYENNFVESGIYNGNFGQYIEKNTGVINHLLLGDDGLLSKGFYDVIMQYKFELVDHSVRLSSAFYV
jgi:hypothetical protein